MALAYIGLGTNLGDRHANLNAAIAALGGHGRVLRSSRRYETSPIGFRDQPDFLNQVVELETALPPHALFQALKRIEQQLGRTTTFRNGPRLIDLDILLLGDVILRDPQLEIPHPRLRQRAFVLRPLAELVETVAGEPITPLLEAVADQSAEPVRED